MIAVPDECYPYPLEDIPAEVPRFWLALIPEAGSLEVARVIAESEHFAAGFVDALS